MMLSAMTGMQAQEVLLLGPAGTKVVFQTGKKIFPCKWRNKKINPEFIPLAQNEIHRTHLVLEASLDKYPAELLEKNLKNIYALQRMFFFGLEYGGTYYKRNVYIANGGLENGYSNTYLEGTFHHEFSSVLLKRHRRHFDLDAWQAANSPEFSYRNGGKEALILNETDLGLDSNLFHRGFLNQYSLASFEEDFNCFAEYIFLNDPGFWQAWEQHEAIRKKTALLISFYHELNSRFTIDYFRKL